MNRVAVVGAGMSRFGTRRLPATSLFAEAFREAQGSVDRGFDPSAIEAAWIGSLGFGGGQIGNAASLLASEIGAPGIPAERVENACASSGFAFRDAYLAIASGAADVALAGGVEVMNDLEPVHQRFWLGVSGDTLWERLAGATFPGVYALLAGLHMHEFGTTREQLASVAVKNHANGARNPKAQFQKEVPLERVLASPMVASPLSVFDCCSTTDGASAVILASERTARAYTDTPVWIEASAAATDALALHDRRSFTSLEATARAGAQAFARAGLRPDDVDVAEVHDCFTIAEILAVEDLGFVPKGKGGAWSDAGRSSIQGDVAVNPSGGLKAKGHPLGATGTAQVEEIFLQLRGEAGARQRSGAEVGLAHNVGGSGATCTVHLFRRG
jgi:acetyl-CoA acetyltransferase